MIDINMAFFLYKRNKNLALKLFKFYYLPTKKTLKKKRFILLLIK